MSISAQTLKALLALDLGEKLQPVLEIIAACHEPSKASLRQARWRAKRLHETSTETSPVDVSKGVSAPPIDITLTPPPSPKTSHAVERDELKAFGEAWNEMAPRLKLPQIEFIHPGSKRERAALARLRDLRKFYDAGFPVLLAKVNGSAFLRGETGWSGCTFDWICKAENFQKIMEGNYAARQKA